MYRGGHIGQKMIPVPTGMDQGFITAFRMARSLKFTYFLLLELLFIIFRLQLIKTSGKEGLLS